ncbi:MAG: hypothetical protein ABI273_14790 [Lacunisphaera sp.]
MKTIVVVLLLLGVSLSAHAQIPVTDLANLANARLQHYETIAKWVDSIAHLDTQITNLKQQVSLQTDIRKWAGDPLEAARRIALDRLGTTDLVRAYGRTRAAIVSTTDSLASLGNTVNGTYRAIENTDLDGGTLVRDDLAHRRYSLLDAQQENFQQVVVDTKERELDLQADLSQTLADLKEASTDAEVHKQTAKVNAINGQLAAIGAERRDQADQVITQKIANDSRLEQERLGAAELEAKNDFLANQRVTAFMRTVKIRQNSP